MGNESEYRSISAILKPPSISKIREIMTGPADPAKREALKELGLVGLGAVAAATGIGISESGSRQPIEYAPEALQDYIERSTPIANRNELVYREFAAKMVSNPSDRSDSVLRMTDVQRYLNYWGIRVGRGVLIQYKHNDIVQNIDLLNPTPETVQQVENMVTLLGQGKLDMIQIHADVIPGQGRPPTPEGSQEDHFLHFHDIKPRGERSTQYSEDRENSIRWDQDMYRSDGTLVHRSSGKIVGEYFVETPQSEHDFYDDLEGASIRTPAPLLTDDKGAAIDTVIKLLEPVSDSGMSNY